MSLATAPGVETSGGEALCPPEIRSVKYPSCLVPQPNQLVCFQTVTGTTLLTHGVDVCSEAKWPNDNAGRDCQRYASPSGGLG